MTWSGNKKIGEGRMTITASQVNELIDSARVLRPFKATNTAEFTFRPDGESNPGDLEHVRQSNFFFKIFGLFMNCDAMAGGILKLGWRV